jgi:DNA-binding Xre family transcriptional regulator
MNDFSKIVNSLKRILKSKGVTYKKLGIMVDLSEASVKRLFSEGSFTLKRLAEICEAVNVSISDVVSMADISSIEAHHEYTDEQETFFVKNPKSLAMFDLLIRHGRVSVIKKQYDISDAKLFKHLMSLERLGLIECHANNRVKFLVSKNVSWQAKGKLRKIFKSKAKDEFLSSDFSGKKDQLKFLSIELGDKSFNKLVSSIQELADEYARISEMELSLGVKTENRGLLMATRNWKFSLLEKI